MKKVSLNDIAVSLGVSKTLVSMVLNGLGDKNGISKETQKRVLEKAEALNYKPNQIARGLRLGKSYSIGLIVADIANPFYARMARSIEDYASKSGYNLIFCSSDENPDKETRLIEMLKDRQVDGIILSSTSENNKDIVRLKKEKYPFVLIDRNFPRMNVNYVGVDNYQGAFDITDHLIRLNYRKIGFIAVSPTHISTVNDRYRGYRDALRNADIRVGRGFVKEVRFDNLGQDIHKVIQEFLMPPDIINAIFAVNNNVAVACIQAMNELNIKIPQDVAFVSFDDVDLFRFSYPPVTAVAQPVEEIGWRAVELLLASMQNKEDEPAGRQVILPTEIRIRRSCGSFFLHNGSI